MELSLRDTHIHTDTHTRAHLSEIFRCVKFLICMRKWENTSNKNAFPPVHWTVERLWKSAFFLHRPVEQIRERRLLSSACMDEVREGTREARKHGHGKYFHSLSKVTLNKSKMYVQCLQWKTIWHWLNEVFCCCYRVKPQHVSDKNYPPTVNITGWMSLLNAPDSSQEGFLYYIYIYIYIYIYTQYI